MTESIDELLRKYENNHKNSIESILTDTDINRLLKIASDKAPGDHNNMLFNAIMDSLRIGYMIKCETTDTRREP